MLSADVLEIAFQARNDRKYVGSFVGELKNKNNIGRIGDLGHTGTVGAASDGLTRGGGGAFLLGNSFSTVIQFCFTDSGRGVLGCGGLHFSFRATQGGLNIDVVGYF